MFQDDGSVLGNTYTITLRGKLDSHKGSPNSAGVFWTSSGYPPDETVAADSRLTAILTKQQALDNLFRVDGGVLEVSGFDGFAPFKCNPVLKKIEFPDGEGKGANWTEYSEYLIVLEAPGLQSLDDPETLPRISKFSEQWNMESLDANRGTFRLTRSLSATGRRVFDGTGALEGGEAWQNARSYVLGTVGLGLKPERMASSGVLDTPELQAFNYLRTESVSETAGLFGVTESWVCYDPDGGPPATHEQTIDCRTGVQDGRVTVGVQGTIQGLEKRDNTNRALISDYTENAEAKWIDGVFPSLLGNAQGALVGFSSTTLNPVPVSQSVGHNAAAGTVTYQYDFDNRPSTFTPGALSEVVTVTGGGGTDVFAQIPIVGRPIGPILQGTGTVTARKRGVSIDIQMPAATTALSLIQPDTDNIALALVPAGTQVFLEDDTTSWTPTTGRYTRSIQYVFE